MESNYELKEINIKNRTCYYFDDIIKVFNFNLDNILVDEKSYEDILVYNISYKNLIGSKPFRIVFNEIDGFIRWVCDRWGYDGTRYLLLFGGEKYDFIYNRIRYLMEIKSCITYVVSHNYA